MRMSIFLLVFLISSYLSGQVEIDQNVKITQADEDNTLTKLLGRQLDGTLAEREINNFVINYFLGLPNGITTLVNAGESFENLLAAGASATDILNSSLFGPCDNGILLDTDDPIEAANALGLCHSLVSAAWVLPDGSPPPVNPNFSLGHGILSSFGPNVSVKEGEHMLALSSGTARTPLDAGYQADFDKGYVNNRPTGFPFIDPVCTALLEAHDGVALKVELFVPVFATGFSFEYKYYTHDFPFLICGGFVDQPAVIVSPSPAGSIPPGNVLYDSNGFPSNVNSSEIITVCTPGVVIGYPCPSAISELTGTGFEGHGASDWQTVSVAAQGNTTIEVTFAIWDSGDGVLASSLLLDNWKWLID